VLLRYRYPDGRLQAALPMRVEDGSVRSVVEVPIQAWPQSVRFTVVACTLTRTSLSLAAGFSTSAIRTTSGGP
jgi:hypothetical protein